MSVSIECGSGFEPIRVMMNDPVVQYSSLHVIVFFVLNSQATLYHTDDFQVFFKSNVRVRSVFFRVGVVQEEIKQNSRISRCTSLYGAGKDMMTFWGRVTSNRESEGH